MKTRIKQRLIFATIIIPIIVLILFFAGLFNIYTLDNNAIILAIIILFSSSVFSFFIINSFLTQIKTANSQLNDLFSENKNNLSLIHF